MKITARIVSINIAIFVYRLLITLINGLYAVTFDLYVSKCCFSLCFAGCGPCHVFDHHFDTDLLIVLTLQVCLSFNPQSTLIATGSMDHTAKLWDVEKGNEVRTLSVSSCSVTP